MVVTLKMDVSRDARHVTQEGEEPARGTGLLIAQGANAPVAAAPVQREERERRSAELGTLLACAPLPLQNGPGAMIAAVMATGRRK